MNKKPLNLATTAAALAFVLTALVVESPVAMSGQDNEQPPTQNVQTFRSRHNLPVADSPGPYRTSSRSPSIFDDSYRRSISVGALSLQSSPGMLICTQGTSWDLQHNDDGQKQIVTLGGDHSNTNVHFAWTHWDIIPESLTRVDRTVNYNGYNPAVGLCLGDCGSSLPHMGPDPYMARAGFVTIDVMYDDNATMFLNQRNEENQPPSSPQKYSAWVLSQGIPCFNLWEEAELDGSNEAEAIWPHGAVDRLGDLSNDIWHVAAHTSSEFLIEDGAIYYWRRVGVAGVWEGPIIIDDDVGSLSHHVATDTRLTSENVAIVYELEDVEGLLQVGYLESTSNGADWLADGTPIYPAPITTLPQYSYTQVTSYSDPTGPQAWLDATGEYDRDGELHIVWIEQVYANQSADSRVKHWSQATGFSTVAEALGWTNEGDQGARDLWLAYPQMGFGDGQTECTDGPSNPWDGNPHSNRNYIYLTYEQYGGPTETEATDVSLAGYQNLEFCLSASNNGGDTWSLPINLTNTQSPGCNGAPGNECSSERDPSIALIVNDAIHMMYILDEDAGDAVFGQGTWTLNPVMYYKIPGGTDAEIVCPEIAPRLAAHLTDEDPDCEYHAPPEGMHVEELIIENLGTDTLAGAIFAEEGTCPCDSCGWPAWLTMTPPANFYIPPGGNRTSSVVMSAAGLPEGVYHACIYILHNDPGLPSPHHISVDFYVFDEFYCSEYATLHTGGTNEGTLWLEVGNREPFGNRTQEDGGLVRLDPTTGDTSWSIYDGSLIIGIPPDPDTTVYRNVYGEGLYRPGFRALNNLIVDTSAYGAGAGEATAFAHQTTVDARIGIDVEYAFPQHPDSSEFAVIRYRIFNRTDTTIPNLEVGVAADIDVMPGTDVADVQEDAWNTGHLWESLNLVYQQGVDTLGHTPIGDVSATRFKAGITAIQCDSAPRGWIAPNYPYLELSPGEGFHEDYLYREMTRNGYDILPPYDPVQGANLHSAIVFEHNVVLDTGTIKRYRAGLISSNSGLDPSDLVNTTKKAWKYCFGWDEILTRDTVLNGAPASYPYYAVGTHEDGHSGVNPCCGCVITKVDGDSELTIVPGVDPCEGTIEFAGGDSCSSPYTATFRVETPDCPGAKYVEDVMVTIVIPGECTCSCPFQSEYDEDGFLTVLDLGTMIDILFGGQPDPADPACPTTRSDFDCDGFTTALDLGGLIDHLFAGAEGPCDPCLPTRSTNAD